MTQRIASSRMTLGAAVWHDSFSIVFEGNGPGGTRLLLRTLKSEEPTSAELQWLRHDEEAHASAPRDAAHECLGRLRIHHKTYLAYRDEGFRPLGSQHLGDLEANLRLARDINSALHRFHEVGMSHFRLSPGTAWVHPDRPGTKLFDLSGASIRGSRPSSTPPPRFAYLAPEQAEPAAFGCDYRSDLFALGAMLYRGITGRRPFEGPDAESHRHQLLTEIPLPLEKVEPTVPSWVSEIVMRLLQKAPEHRYQTHYGLAYDLEQSLSDRGGKLGSGELQVGERDQLAAFRVPNTFRGREGERAAILDAARGARFGPLRVVAITGAPGVGKSGLVNAVFEEMREAGLEAASAKADQFSADIHYGLFAEAIEASLTRMAAIEGQLDLLVDRVKSVLGVNSSLIADVIPELSAILGDLREAPEVPPSERLNRFNATFEKFIRVLVEIDGPCCFFFDDLQWADSGSLALLEYLVSARSLTGVLFLLSFRDAGEGSARAEESFARLAESGASVSRIRLEGLELSYLTQLVLETFGPATSVSMCEQLSALIHKRTGGNPLFARHLLEHLHQEGLLVFDGQRDCWNWDRDEIAERAITDDVVDLARAKLDALVPRAKAALVAGACISNPFEPQRIASLIDESEGTVRGLLDQAADKGVLAHVGWGYRFIHDELAQAAYSLVPDAEVAITRFRFGERLLVQLAPLTTESVPVDVVNNINFGLDSVTDPETRLSYAALNLRAGQEARQESAYRDALSYFRAGIQWAPNSAWQYNHRFMFELYSEAFESEYLNGNVAAADALFDLLEARTNDRYDLAEVVYTKILLLTSQNRGDEAVETGINALRSLGMRISAHPRRTQVVGELLLARLQTAFRSPDRLAEVEFSDDKTLKATNALLMIIGPAAYFGNTDIMAFAGLRLLNRSLARAHTTESAFGYVIYGLVLSAVTSKPAAGYRYAKLAMKLSDRGGDIVLRCKILLISGAFIAFWSQPVKTALKILSESLAQCFDAGDVQYANYTVLGTVSLMFSTGKRLTEVLAVNERYEALVRRTNDSFSLQTHRLWWEAIRTMLDESDALLAASAEEEAMRQFRLNRNQTALTYFWILKTQLHYLEEDYETAYEFGIRAREHVDSVLGQIVAVDLFFYLGLSAAACAKAEKNRNRRYINTLSDSKRRLRKWAEGCPENFRQQYELLSAELESVRGKNALNTYERTMRSAAKNEFTHVEALANELAAQHLEQAGHDELSGVFLERAWRLYRDWDGYRKARLLASKHAHLGVLEEVARRQAKDDATQTDSGGAPSMRRSGLANSVDAALEELRRVANADWGVVFRFRVGGLHLESACDDSRDPESAQTSAIVRYVAKTGTRIAIRDCGEDTRFAQCPYLTRYKPRSAFCIMLGDRDDPLGVVYLENRSVPGIFSETSIGAINAQLTTIEATLARIRMLDDLREKDLRLEQTRHTISTLERHRDQLGKFVPVPVRRLLEENPETSDLIREDRQVSVMFVDIAGYTQMSERLGKEAVERLLDTYFSSFAEEIWQHDGEIVETAGDGFMAVFESPTHEDLATRTALVLQARTAELNRRHQSQFPEVVINIGINSGPALVGLSRLGGKTDERWVYTVHGPTTNLASRIADLSSGGQILISATTAGKVGGEVEVRDLGLVHIKGISRGVRLFEISRSARDTIAVDTTTAEED